MKALTRRRRNQWPTRAEGEDHFRNTGFLRGWDNEVAQLYLTHALRDHEDGSCSLRTDSRVEMETYSVDSQVFNDVFQGLSHIACPVGLVSCAQSDNFPPATLNLTASKLRTSLVYTVDAHHLMPMTHLDTMGAYRAPTGKQCSALTVLTCPCRRNYQCIPCAPAASRYATASATLCNVISCCAKSSGTTFPIRALTSPRNSVW